MYVHLQNSKLTGTCQYRFKETMHGVTLHSACLFPINILLDDEVIAQQFLKRRSLDSYRLRAHLFTSSTMGLSCVLHPFVIIHWLHYVPLYNVKLGIGQTLGRTLPSSTLKRLFDRMAYDVDATTLPDCNQTRSFGLTVDTATTAQL